MVNLIKQSNQNHLSEFNIDDSGGVDLFWDREDSSTKSNLMTTDMNLNVSMVEETLKALTNTSEEPTKIAESTDSFDDQLIAENSISDEPITGIGTTSTAKLLNFSEDETVSLESGEKIELNKQLIITDREIGVLELGDDTYQGRYKDEYVLRDFEDNQTVVLNLETLAFNGFLEVFNRNTGEVIEETSESQLSFTIDQTVEYLVQVTSTGESTTGSYTLETTVGELILGLSDQVIKGTLSETDQEIDLWVGRYSDTYEVTQISNHQTLNIELTSFEYNTIVFLINADTRRHLDSEIAFNPNQDGSYSSHISWSVDADINYGVVVSSYQGYRTGDYTLSINTNSSVSGSFDSTDDSNHPIIRTHLMDNYLLSSLQAGEDVSLKLSSDSSNIMQLFDHKTGDVLQTSLDSHLNFSVEEGITYGVRVLGEEGQDYNLTTDTGFLFDSTVIEFDQPLTASLVTSDMVNMFARNSSLSRYYGDGYYVSGDKLLVGETLTIHVESEEFIPSLYLVNAKTGELIDNWRGSQKQKTVNLIAEEEMDYLIMVSSIYGNEVGEYTFKVE
ncbi:MAG: hypothetical protein QNJ64_00900 [Crocosphaera sp.]|nr:hypothetical protein [Crocosphaera sp.]